MANTYAATLAGLAPDIDFPLDEGSGVYANNGSSGNVDLTIEGGSGILWRRAPGIIRNAPYEYAFWADPNQEAGARSAVNAAGIPNTATWDVGAMVCCIRRFSDVNNTVNWTVMGVGNASLGTWGGANNYAKIQVDSSGVLWWSVGASPTSLPSTGMRCRSDNPVITTGGNYHVVAVQRNDGTGIHLFVNGVEVPSTTSAGASASINDWVSRLDNGGIYTGNTVLTINGYATGATPTLLQESDHALVQRPSFFTSPLSDSQVLALANAASLDATPTDYYEYVFENLINPNPGGYWQPGRIGGVSNVDPFEGADIAAGSTRMSSSNFALANIAETDRVTAYENWKNRYGINTTWGQSLSSGSLDNDSIGTFNILLTINSFVNVGFIQWMMGFGEGVGGNDDNCIMYLGGTALGTSLVWTMGEVGVNGAISGANFFRRVILPADGAFPLTDPLPIFTMITVVQDGTGVKIYRDAEELTGGSDSQGGTYDDTSWFVDGAPYTAERMVLGYPGSANINNMGDNVAGDGQDVHDYIYLRNRALAAEEISELWDAVRGIFPNGASPPDGGFNDTLGETGNETDPNGPGPDHYWRMNANAAPVPDVGISTVVGTTIAEGGDPDYQVNGPLINDPTNAAIYFDGQGDYLEVGVDGLTGQLVTFSIGTVGFFIALNAFDKENIVYSQANDLGTAKIQWGITNNTIRFLLQTSAGNTVQMDASIPVTDRDFVFVVMTNDGSDYLMYVQGQLDPSAVVTTQGTGAEGQWFDDITATRSALSALANSTFTTETTARSSEVFIYKEVLNADQIAGLFEAAVRDGILGAADTIGVLDIKNARLINGGFADINLRNALTDFAQILKVGQSTFEGGYEAADAQSIYLEGDSRATVKGTEFDLQVATPVDGRAAVVATVADPTAGITTFGDVTFVDNTLRKMGNAARAGVYLEAGHGGTIEKNRFLDAVGAAMGWRGDARNVTVAMNEVEGMLQGVAAIRVQNGLNTQIGNNWLIERNILEDVVSGVRIEGANSSLAEFARDLNIRMNKVANASAEAFYLDQVQDVLVQRNEVDGATDAYRIKQITGLVTLRRNIAEAFENGIIMQEGSLQAGELVLDRNILRGAASGIGITVSNVVRALLLKNWLLSLSTGVQLGDIGTGIKIMGNLWKNVATDLAVLGGTTQNGVEFDQRNQLTASGLTDLTVVANDVNVSQNFHTVTSASAVDLNNIGGFGQEGFVTVIQLANGSSNITAKDGVGDMELAGDFLMANPGKSQLWLVYNGGSWCELSRLA